MLLRTSAPGHVLRRSGQQGVFTTSSPSDTHIREGYSVVWAPENATLAQMQEQLEAGCQGIALKGTRMGWRIATSSEQAFRQRVGVAERKSAGMFFEITYVPSATSSIALATSLAQWGWHDVVAIRPSSLPEGGKRSWIIGAPNPPPATTLILGSSLVEIRGAPKRRHKAPLHTRTAQSPPAATSQEMAARKPLSGSTNWKMHTAQIPAPPTQLATRTPSGPIDALLARLGQFEKKMQMREEKMEAALAAHKKDADVRMQQQQSAQEDKEKWHTATSTDQQARLEKMEGMLAKIMSHMERTTVATQPTQRRASTASAAEPSQKNRRKAAQR